MLRFLPVLALVGTVATAADACETCRPRVQAGVYKAGFAKELATLLLPVGLIVGIAGGLARMDGGRR